MLLFFSVGLATMSKHVAKPGAFFTYVGYGLGRPLGPGAAWLALLTYTAVQVAVYGYIGSRSELRRRLGGPDVPWYLWTSRSSSSSASSATATSSLSRRCSACC